MNNFIKNNKAVFFGAIVVFAFLWAGKQMKNGREEKLKALQDQAAQSTPPTEHGPESPSAATAVSRPMVDSEGNKLYELGETFGRDGKKTVLLSKTSPAQLDRERRARDIAMTQAQRNIFVAERKAMAEVHQASVKQFKALEVDAQIAKIEAKPAGSGYERSNEYARLRNQISLSSTNAAEKTKMLAKIDAKLNAVKIEPFKGYVSTLQPDGSVALTPR